MDFRKKPFVPPHPEPRTVPPSVLEIIRVVMRNPLELWGMPSFTEDYIKAKFLNERTVIANDPSLIKHVLVDNAKNYRMATIRQLILRPILREGLLTAEGETWKRSRKAMAPVFTPRHIHGFADSMLKQTQAFCTRYETGDGLHEISHDMTELTFDILAETLFSGEIVSDNVSFAEDVEKLLNTMGRVDPMDLLKAPSWVPRIFRFGGQKVLNKFRKLVSDTAQLRRSKMRDNPGDVPQDFLTLLLQAEGPQGLSSEEIDDNIITFIGAGHETTARSLGWTLYCLANSPDDRILVEEEIAEVMAKNLPPVAWLENMPKTRAAFEEAMRLYPPAPSINRAAIEDDQWGDLTIEKGVTVLVMPWTVHRHHNLWDEPNAYIPSRFWPENRDQLHRFQYLPFGAGPRICIGASFALQEAVIALGVLMSRFRFDMAEGAKHPWPVQTLTTQPKGGLHMKVTPRK